MKRNDAFIIKNVGGKKVLVPIGMQVANLNGFIILNDIAAFVWELLAEDCSLDKMTSAIIEQFDISPENAHADLHSFLNEIEKMGLFGKKVNKSLTPSSDYNQFVAELHSKAAACGQPINGAFELTERCNLNCQMCYICQLPSDRIRRKKELSSAAWLELAHQAVDNGMLFLLLTGGEVFLRPDFFDIYTPLTRLGLILTLFTNGTLITEDLAAHLAEAPPSRTEITLYGATAATYEAITGVPGSYASCCNGIATLVKNHIPLTLKSTITQQNIGELKSMRRMANNWGLSLSVGWLLSKRRDGIRSKVVDCRLKAADCMTLESIEPISSSEWKEVSMHTLCHDANFNCQAGQTAFVVNSYGEMNVCIELPLPAVLPLEIGFSRAWEQVQHFVEDSPPLAPRCLVCEVRLYCPRCPAWSQLETSTLTEPVPYLCEIAHARKKSNV